MKRFQSATVLVLALLATTWGVPASVAASDASAGAQGGEGSQGGAVPADAGPAEVVRSASDRLETIIDRHEDGFEADPQPYLAEVETVMADFVDFDGIARAVMGDYWSEATPGQRERFVGKFREGLVRSYGRALMGFDYRKIEVLPVPPEHRRGNRALVRMNITGTNGQTYQLRYSMSQGDAGRWEVANVVVDGVNLGLTYRNQFASAMQSPTSGGSIDAVIEDWTISGDAVTSGS